MRRDAARTAAHRRRNGSENIWPVLYRVSWGTPKPAARSWAPLLHRRYSDLWVCAKQARYRIVRMQSDPGVVYGMVQCMVCDQSLAPIENEYILK